jgi:ACGX-repeat protein
MGKLNLLAAWNSSPAEFFAGKSAQSFLSIGQVAMAVNGTCGSSCGAKDDDKKKEQPKPGACGASCGAGDDGKKKEEPKPSACGSSCGAGDDKRSPKK